MYMIIISFVGNTKAVFHPNMAERGGGALYSYDHCNITLGKYSIVTFVSNSAMQCGGAVYCGHHFDVTLEGTVTFTTSTAEHGGAVCVAQSIIKCDRAYENRACGLKHAMLFDLTYLTTEM